MGKRWQHTNSPSIHRAQFQCRLFHNFISWGNGDPGTNHAGTGGASGGARRQGLGGPPRRQPRATASDTHPGPTARASSGAGQLLARRAVEGRRKMLLLRSELESGGFPAQDLRGVCLLWGVLRGRPGASVSCGSWASVRILSLQDCEQGAERCSGEPEGVSFGRRLDQDLFRGDPGREGAAVASRPRAFPWRLQGRQGGERAERPWTSPHPSKMAKAATERTLKWASRAAKRRSS